MLRELRHQFARFIAPAYFEWHDQEMKDADAKVLAYKKDAEEAKLEANRRFADLVMQMDPLEPLFRRLSIVYSKEYTRPEDKLDEKSRLSFIMWAWGQSKDPHFTFLIDWVMNSHGNESLKRAPVTNERTLYGRAQISSMVLLRDEVGRLASLYEEQLEAMRQEKFDTATTVD